MNEQNTVLISLKTFSHKGSADLRNVLKNLAKEFEIIKVSSVYKVNRRSESLVGLRDIRKEERLEGLVLVVHAHTRKEARLALAALAQTERDLQRELLKRTVSLNLLVFNWDVIMLPGLAIPHPEMHLRPEELVPAVELWPDYVHPVLQKSLLELSRSFADEKWGEFFTQGQPLLDFLRPEA